MPVENNSKCSLNNVVIDIIKAQYKNRTKVEVTKFLMELLYQDKMVIAYAVTYQGSRNEKIFWQLIDYLGLSDYLA